jgi:hypothetical protein
MRRTVLWIWEFARRRTHRAIRLVISLRVKVQRSNTHASSPKETSFLVSEYGNDSHKRTCS